MMAPQAGSGIDAPLLGPPSGSERQVVAYIRRHLPANSEYQNDVETIMGYYWRYGLPVGLDPFLAAVQCIHETAALTSAWAARPHRNPAGIGVTGEPGKGVSFPSWAEAVRAHLGRLLAYALAPGVGTPAQQALITEALHWRSLPANRRGAAPTLRKLAGTWAADPRYADKIARLANAIRAL